MATVVTPKEAPSLAYGPHLLVLNGPQRNQQIGLDFARLENRPLLLGRQADQVDVVLRSFQGSVSRRHTYISYRNDDKLVVASDAGSSNGTYLNGARLAGPTPLLPGDTLRIGDVELLFIVPILNMSVPVRPPQKPALLEDLEPGMARLEIVTSQIPALPGAFGRLTPQHPFVIGRHSLCDLRLVEEGSQARFVSRRQAEIRWGQQGYVVRDPGAANPLLVNNQPLLAPHELVEGDLIQIASTVIRYRAPRAPFRPAWQNRPPDAQAPVAPAPPSDCALLRLVPKWVLHSGPKLLVLPVGRPLVIGRSQEANLRLNDPSVSRHHAQLFSESGSRGFMLSDLGSTNGTFINGQEVTNIPVLVKPGDRVKLGEFEFTFEIAGAEALAADGLPKEPAASLTEPATLQLALDATGHLVPAGATGQLPANPDREFASTVFSSAQIQIINPALFKPEDGRAAAVVPAKPPSRVLELLADPSKKYSFEELVAEIGQAAIVGGNQPFLLDEQDTVWLVRQGKVELFAVQVQSGQAVNARYHVGTVPAGQALFCLDQDEVGEGLGLLAVCSVNTELLKLALSDLRLVSREPELAPSLALLVDQWLTNLSQDLTRGVLNTRLDVLLDADADVQLEENQKVGIRKGGAWGRLDHNHFLLLGEEDLGEAVSQLYFPFYGQTWLLALRDSKIATFSTLGLLDSDELWNGLELFYELFFRVKFTTIRLATYDEINRLRKKTELDFVTGYNALVDLSDILEGGTRAKQADLPQDLPVRPEVKDPVLAACRLLGQAMNLEVHAPPAKEDLGEGASYLREIARVSRFRVRQIKLERTWWKEENGPLLGIYGTDRIPVALLPSSQRGSRYIMANPVEGTRRPVTAEVAADLDKAAYMFYRPLPLQKLKAFDLLKFGFRGTRKDLLITSLMGIFGGLLGLFIPIVTGYLFDTAIPSSQVTQLWQVLLGLAVIAFSATTFQITRSIAVLRLETRVDLSLQAALWDRLLDLPVPFFRNYTVGDLADRTLSIEAIRQIISATVVTSIVSSFFSLFSFFLLFTYDLGLALVALGLALITIGVVLFISLRQLRFQRTLTEQHGKLSGQVVQLISGVAKLRVAGAEIRAFAVWAKAFARQRKTAFQARLVGIWLVIFNAIWPIVTLMVIFFALNAFHNPNLSIGNFLAFMAAFSQFLAGMVALTGAFITGMHAIPYYERSRPVLETLPEVNADKADPGQLSGAIEVNHAFFRYNANSPYILDDVSLKIKPGQFVAVVGPSGAGKSSLLRLLLGFETPEAGSIYYDDQDIKNLNVQALRRQMGVVTQNGKLMQGDILTNIIGSAPFSLDDAWEAARLAGLEKDIKAMPMGMFTVLSETGSTLSGGQRQRLMIARAIIGKPRILLFDEATSALDNQTQAIVSESLENLRATRIVIAHRLSTVIHADCIYVLQGGKIVQSGTYGELIEQPGPFQELAKRQLA